MTWPYPQWQPLPSYQPSYQPPAVAQDPTPAYYRIATALERIAAALEAMNATKGEAAT